jgi:hypothetical protein
MALYACDILTGELPGPYAGRRSEEQWWASPLGRPYMSRKISVPEAYLRRGLGDDRLIGPLRVTALHAARQRVPSHLRTVRRWSESYARRGDRSADDTSTACLIQVTIPSL